MSLPRMLIPQNQVEDNREMFTSVDISYSKDEGNTNYKSLYYGFDFSILGNVGPLKDTEFSINFSKTDDVFDGELFANDQYLTILNLIFGQIKDCHHFYFFKNPTIVLLV